MNILLAVDGSDHSYEAARALQFFARAKTLTIIHVLDVPKPAYPMMMPEVARELYIDLERAMAEEGERLLDRIRSLLPMNSGPVTKQLAVGSPADMIVKAVESALAAGKKDDALAALKLAQPELARGVARGVIHKNTASRKFSRLTKRVAALG